MVQGWLRAGRGAGKAVPSDEDGHMAGIFGQKYAFFRRREPASDHKNLSPGKKFAVAGGAVGHASPLKRILPGKANPAGVRPCG